MKFSCIILLAVVLFSCKGKPNEEVLFTVRNATETGLNFTNKLTATPEFNMFKYMYFYNGAGVGAGDFNNDGLTDLFFSSNQGDNKLFLNEGKLHFKDVTNSAGIVQDHGWSTGVSVVDINNDGLLDIYVCKVGNYEVLKSNNQLFVCKGLTRDGIPMYEEKAASYGIDFSGFNTQAAFFDYDADGDLDLFLLNHSVHQNGTFGARKNYTGTYHPLSGDRIFRNDENVFTDVTKATGINSSAISYGLGVCISDIDLDGDPDMYIGNDFHENDYLYINRHDGSFSEETTKRLMHTSQFSMGVDVADINNDAFPEIISMDMLPEDPYILKRSLGEDEFNIFNLKIGYGYNHQYTRNNLQLNRRNGMFSEIGMYSNVFATDWSWAALWMDFNNDGLKDLFVSNGIPKRLNDIDYVNYVSNSEIQQKIRDNRMGESDMALIDKFPQIKLPNKFYINKGNAEFADAKQNIGGDVNTFSNGSVYADLDNDGDLDVVVNNIDDPVLIYENRTNSKTKTASISLRLKGSSKNVNAVGAKAIVYSGSKIMTYEKFPVRGFQSSMEIPLHIGINHVQVDSAVLIWPDNSFQLLNVKDSVQTLTYKTGLPLFDYAKLRATAVNTTNLVADITAETSLQYYHKENPFVEFDREPLIPFMVSKDGPALAIADINHDGTEDVFIGSSKTFTPAVFLQSAAGRFTKTVQPAFGLDSMWEETDATWVDVNGDTHVDLVAASGGNEYYGKDEHLTPRVFLNDGKGNLTKKTDAFGDIFLTASCIEPYDFNNDGSPDLFIGGRAVPWEYGDVPHSYFLQNNGKGNFKDVTSSLGKDLSVLGFVKSAEWFDLDKDGDKDLLVSLEWGELIALMNDRGKFTKKLLTDKKGFWNFMLPCDIDNDGDVDLIAGNWGLNHRLKVSNENPVRLYYNDFDGNGKKEQLVTYYLGNKEIPFANKDELQKQMPLLKKKFLYAENFAEASLSEIFSTEKLSAAKKQQVNYCSNAVLINDGKMNFSLKALPWEAQLTPYKTAVVVNADNNDLPDILLFGNFYESNIQMGRYDADFGTLLINKGKGNFETSLLNGVTVKGQVRHAEKIIIKGKESILLAKNNDSTMIIQFKDVQRSRVIKPR